ncbi:MAG: alanine--tRNA ligase [Candidatus Woesearchaeota archaeon]|nr:alanine--tRNA ligase [Candidatus Woesearchaeota archaeon]
MKQLTSKELKDLYFGFFSEKGHKLIASASLIPEHDPTVLFTAAGMHPLVPFLIGQPHPQGKRLVDVQKCLRTDDIDEVGDSSHLTFFEMLGNWSLGDYWKKEAIEWSYEFLTDRKWLGINKEKISVTCFKGDNDAPKDEESAKIWLSVGIPKERIYFLPKKDNWWGPAGETGPCGPDSEMFYDTGKEKCSNDCKPGCFCGKYFEIWNDVFMQYNKTKDGRFEKLKQQNVDTGMGVERTAAVLQGKKIVYEIETFKPIIDKIKEIAKIKEPNEEQLKSVRIITDHIRAATFILGDEKAIAPSNVDQGYILRRFIRRSIRHGKLLGIEKEFLSELAKITIELHKSDYKELEKNKDFILDELKKEDEKFRKTLENGLKEFEKIIKNKKEIDGENAFLLFQSFGFPIEMTAELAKEKNVSVDVTGFNKEFEKHQELSRIGAEKKFKGGLADSSEETTKLHTATHMLNQALRVVLGKKDIFQRGSNITPERLRFDFNFDRKLTEQELKEVEDLINEKIKEALPVKQEEMTVDEAKKKGAQGVFEHKYGEKVFVYSIGDFSVEICGGPHVKNTSELGHFKIIKEESVAAGVRRIKAVLIKA